jgi:hypothetical protein
MKDENKATKKKNVFDMLLEEIISRSNVQQAYERVVTNKCEAGVDCIGFLDFAGEVRAKCPLIKSQLEKENITRKLLNGSKSPKPTVVHVHWVFLPIWTE